MDRIAERLGKWASALPMMANTMDLGSVGFDGLPTLLADEVANSFSEQLKEPGFVVPERLEEIAPSVAPPWDTFVVEWQSPPLWGGRFREGVLIRALEPSVVRDCPADWRWVLTCDSFLLRPTDDPTDYPHDPSWYEMICACGGIENSFARVSVAVSANGVPLKHDVRMFRRMDGQDWGNEEMAEDESWASHVVTTALLAVSLANCGNVRLKQEPVSRQVRRNAERKGTPLIGYYVLDIAPMRGYAQSAAKSAASGMALHVQRGHFKDYRDGPGLFGKHRKVYWWGPQLKGNIELGAVEKDYRIQCAS